jgi:hypothetical protein
MPPFLAQTHGKGNMSDRIEWITIITALTGLLIGLILIYLAWRLPLSPECAAARRTPSNGTSKRSSSHDRCPVGGRPRPSLVVARAAVQLGACSSWSPYRTRLLGRRLRTPPICESMPQFPTFVG